jgi:phosphoglycolate phosphatase
MGVIMDEKRVVIFDFDGTIADTFSVVVDIVNTLPEEFGIPKLGIEEIAALRHKRAQELLKVFKIPIWKIPKLLFTVKERLSNQIHTVEAFPDVLDVLQELKAQGYMLGVLSSNTQETVDAFLRQNNVAVFDFVYCEKDIFGKARVLKKLMERYELRRDQVVYVGDETRDVEAAHAAKVKVIAVTWGYNTARALENQRPDKLVDKPQELVDSVGTLF